MVPTEAGWPLTMAPTTDSRHPRWLDGTRLQDLFQSIGKAGLGPARGPEV